MPRWAAVLLLCARSLAAQDFAAEDVAYFEQTVRPLLTANCFPCHNQNLQTSGLALDTRDGVLTGGNRGQAVYPGRPDQSILIQAVEQSGNLEMPPTRALSGEQIAIFRRWIERGVAWSAETAVARPKGWDHWAFQAPQRSPLPEVRQPAWGKNEIDRFVLARIEMEGLAPSPEADRYTLLRRVSLDLTGLPPSPAEIRAFVNDRSPDAYEKVVDRLLASPHFGERWARHWLDLARYSDSDGYTIDDPRPISMYRDWVINALNRDQPFDQFTIDQIAGDLLPGATVDQLAATGFHRNTGSNYEGGIDFEQYRNEAVADRVATTGGVFLGLSLGCARCHDHKYDPISQREFYRLFAYFNNTDEITTEAERRDFLRPVLEAPTEEDHAQVTQWETGRRALDKKLIALVHELIAEPEVEGEPLKYQDPRLREMLSARRRMSRSKPMVRSTLIMRELPTPRQAYIHLGGDFTRHGTGVSPGTPAVLGSPLQGGNRLDLARWLVDRKNPLTARVTVNRMWQALFGKGLVETENDFGLVGSVPTHPQLLDWLAVEFMDRGWSQKTMLREMVTSATYRQASHLRPELEERDPYNRLLTRQSRLRVEAEIVRDSALVASGLLNPRVGGESVFPPVPPGAVSGTQIRKPWPTAFDEDRYRRGLYTFAYRSLLHPGLGLFDAPDGTASCTRRVRSNSPLQSLTLLNDTAYVEFSRALGKRIAAEAAPSDTARIDYGFLLALGRNPSQAERDRVSEFLALQRDEFQSDPASAIALLGGESDRRALDEAKEAANAAGGGAQSARGKAVMELFVRKAAEQLELGEAAARQRAAGLAAMDANDLRDLAAWTAVSRVLLNLDDFITRD